MDLAALYGLRLRTDRLELRWPDEQELVELARLAETGVHDPEEMPFVVPWTDRIGEPGFVDEFVAFHEGLRRDWRADNWQLELGVWAADELIGVQGIVGHDGITFQLPIVLSLVYHCCCEQGPIWPVTRESAM